MKVSIDNDRQRHTGGWFYSQTPPPGTPTDSEFCPARSRERWETYAQCVAAARAAGHEIANGGWKHKMLSWNFNSHALDGYPGWQIEDAKSKSPAFVKLAHVRVEGADVESSVLCNAWDDVAEVDFYQRDWTEDGIPFVSSGVTYWSGWWFATIAERDRFVAWHAERSKS